MKPLLSLLLLLSLAGCFSPVVYLKHKTHYAVDVFYENQRPDRPFDPIQDLEIKGEVPLSKLQEQDKRMVKRGNDAEQKDIMLNQLASQAKKIGADALVAVRYTYYTSTSSNGYVMSGLAVRYKKEVETTTK